MEKYNGLVVESFLDSDQLEIILDFAKNTDGWERSEPGSFWDNRVMAAQNIYRSYSKEVGLIMLDIRNRTAEEIKKHYQIPEIYADVTVLARWFPGQEQPPHADDMSNVEGHEAFHHREFGSILYLNTVRLSYATI